MKNRKRIGLLCLALAVVLTAGAVLSAAAAGMVSDVDGDGRITAFDAQLIAESNAGKRQLSETQLSAVKGLSVRDMLNYVLGIGVIRIRTVRDLQKLCDQPDGNFILQNDLDLEGADWTPVANFSGSFDGGGHTISNFTLTACVADPRDTGIYNQGFFGDTAESAQIFNLHLQNVTLTAAADATAAGFFAGTLRGALTGCTATGTILDTREAYPAAMYTGVFAGRLLSGRIVGGTNLSFTDEYGRKTTKKLCASAAVLLESDGVNGGGKVGLAGYAADDTAVTGTWLDTSHSTGLLSQTLRERRQTVVDYMNTMATVEWTPVTDLYYTAANGTDQIILAGEVHVGLPYNGHSGSYERFLSAMESQDENGVWTAKADLESGGWDSSVISKYYVRPYANTNNAIGASIQITQKYLDEVIAMDDNGYLYLTANGNTYYMGAAGSNEHIHMTGTAATDRTAQLYDVSGAVPAVVTEPTENAVYKLGVKDTDGTVQFFTGNTGSVNGSTSLIVTPVPENAADIHAEFVSGGFRLWFELPGEWSDTGFYLTMGNACNSSVSWAWRQVSGILVNDAGQIYKGGFNPRGAQGMIPTDANRENYGMYPVGDWEATAVNDKGKIVVAEWDPSKAAYQCTDEIYTPDILNKNGLDTIYEAYAQSHKGDALVCYVDDWSAGNPGPGGHVRMIVADPVVIRGADGVIDGKASYLIETEQGVGFTRGATTSTWAYAKRYSFYEFAGKPASMPTSLDTKTYLPMTIRALQEEYQPGSKVTEVTKTQAGEIIPPISPTEGLIYSEHSINSVTVTVVNGSGTVLYQHEAFSGISSDFTLYADSQMNRLFMADLHAEAFYEAADGLLRPNRSYYCHVDVTLSTGETIRLVENRAFTYTAP